MILRVRHNLQVYFDFTYLTCCPVRAEFTKAKWWLDTPQKGDDIQVFDSTPRHRQDPRVVVNQSINQSIQSYIALLYIPEVALQSPESSTVIPVVVSYLSSHSCPGAD